VTTKNEIIQQAVEAAPQYWREDPETYKTKEARRLWLVDTVADMCADNGIEVNRAQLHEELDYYA
jgi:hypothetical protein